MKKTPPYRVHLVLNSVTFRVTAASCKCPAGKGQNGSCKHIGAFCYAFESFCLLGATPDFLTCTDVLQTWYQPQGPKVDLIPVEMLCARKCEILNKVDTSSVVFDPRPKQFQNNNPNSVESLHCDLLNVCDNGSAVFLTVLVPSTTNIEHDHTYASKADEAEGQILPQEDTSNEGSEVEENDEEPDDESDKKASRTDESIQSIYARKLVTVISLCISGKERDNLEKLTRQQSDESLWYDARRLRITG